MEPYPGHVHSSFPSSPPHPSYSQSPIQQPHSYPQQADPRAYPQDDYARRSYQPPSLTNPGSYPYPPAGNAHQSHPHAFPTQHHPQPRYPTSQPLPHEPPRVYPIGGSQQRYSGAAQQGVYTGPPFNVQPSQPHLPPYYYHSPPAQALRQSPPNSTVVPPYPINAYDHQDRLRHDFRSSQSPMNYTARQPSQPPFPQTAPQSRARSSPVFSPSHFSGHQSPPPPTNSQTQQSQPLRHTSSQLAQTQSFTSLDGWHAYDPTAEASKPSRKKPAKKPMPSTKATPSKTAQDNKSSKGKQVRISESVTGQGATAATPATTTPSATANPSPVPARTDPSQPSTTPRSAPVPATEPTTSATARRLPRRGNLPPPDGQVPLTFMNEKTPRAKLEFWQALTEDDQRRMHEKAHERKSRKATAAEGPATGISPPQGQASSAAAPSGPKEKEKETGQEKGKGEGKAHSKSADTAHSGSSRAAMYKAATVEDVPEESDGGVSYASDPPLRKSNRQSPAREKATRPRRTTPPFAVSSEQRYGSTHLSVKVLDVVHQTQDRLDRLEHTVSSFLRKGDHRRSSARKARSTKGHTHPEDDDEDADGEENEDDDADDADDADDEDEDADDDDDEDADEDEDDDDDEDDDHALRSVQSRADTRTVKRQPHKKRLTEIVRKYVDLELLKIHHTSELPTLFPKLTDKELSDYRAGKYPPFSEEKFRICFVRQWIRCAWNFGAREFIVNSLVDICQRKAFTGNLEGPPLPRRYFTRKVMEGAVDSHVEYLRGKYKEHTDPVTPAKEAKTQKRKKDNLIARRKQTTLNARQRTANRHGLVSHAALLKKLDPCHMSGDEVADNVAAGTSGQSYHIIEAAWQSREFKICVWDLDLWNIKDFNDYGRGGSRPRRRVAVQEPRVVDSPAPVGLWRNCYDPDWLRKLDAPRRRLLRIIDEDFDFTLPERQNVVCGTNKEGKGEAGQDDQDE